MRRSFLEPLVATLAVLGALAGASASMLQPSKRDCGPEIGNMLLGGGSYVGTQAVGSGVAFVATKDVGSAAQFVFDTCNAGQPFEITYVVSILPAWLYYRMRDGTVANHCFFAEWWTVCWFVRRRANGRQQ